MRKPELLVVTRYSDEDMLELERHYTLHVLSDASDPEAFLAQVGPGIRAVATNGESGANARLIDALPDLEIIVCYGVGWMPLICLTPAAAIFASPTPRMC